MVLFANNKFYFLRFKSVFNNLQVVEILVVYVKENVN